MSKGGYRPNSGRKSKIKVPYPMADFVHIFSNCEDEEGNPIISVSMARRVYNEHRSQIEKILIALHDSDIYTEEDIYNRNIQKIEMAADEAYPILKGIDADISWDDVYELISLSKNIKEEFIDTINVSKQHALKALPNVEVGKPKKTHIHIIMLLRTRRRIDEIARWFSLEPRFCRKKDKKNAIYEWQYPMHINDENKHKYDAYKYIQSGQWFASFDYCAEMEEYAMKEEQHQKYRMSNEEIADLMEDVKTGKLALWEVEDILPVCLYSKNKKAFRDAREQFLSNQEMRQPRIVIYVGSEPRPDNPDLGIGRIGKTVATQALATLYAGKCGADMSKSYSRLRREGYIYQVGEKGSALTHYDNHPILVCNEFDAGRMISTFGGIEQVKELLETFPSHQDSDIKYSDTFINAEYIIINGIQPFEKFKKGLCGEYIDRFGNKHTSEADSIEQITERFFAHIMIHQMDVMDIFLNEGLFVGLGEYNKWLTVKNISVNFRKIKQKLDDGAFLQITQNVFTPLLDYTDNFKSKQTAPKISAVNDVPEEFKSYGTIIT